MRWKLTTTVDLVAARTLEELSLRGYRGGRNPGSSWRVAILATAGLQRVPTIFKLYNGQPAMQAFICNRDSTVADGH